MPIAKKDLIHLSDLSVDEIWQVLSKAREMKQVLAGPDKKYPILRGKSVINLFTKTVPEQDRPLNLPVNIWVQMW